MIDIKYIFENENNLTKHHIHTMNEDDNPDLKYYKSLARQFANNQSII